MFSMCIYIFIFISLFYVDFEQSWENVKSFVGNIYSRLRTSHSLSRSFLSLSFYLHKNDAVHVSIHRNICNIAISCGRFQCKIKIKKRKQQSSFRRWKISRITFEISTKITNQNTDCIFTYECSSVFVFVVYI